MLFGKKKANVTVKSYDKENLKPVIRCSICTGEQTAGFKHLHSGAFYEDMLIRSDADLETFKAKYGLTDVERIY